MKQVYPKFNIRFKTNIKVSTLFLAGQRKCFTEKNCESYIQQTTINVPGTAGIKINILYVRNV